MQIREKLKVYNKALCYQAAIHKLEPPDDFDIRDIHKFISSDEVARTFIADDRFTWRSFSKPHSYSKDGFVSLKMHSRTGAFKRVMAERRNDIMELFGKIFTKQEENAGRTGTENVTFLITGLIAATLSVLIIIIPARTSTTNERLAAIIEPNGVIVFNLWVFTEAERHHTFFLITVLLLCITIIEVLVLIAYWLVNVP